MNKKKYDFVVSNPCFELWILLHLLDISEESPEEQGKMLENKKSNKKAKTYLEKIITRSLGSYNKANPEFEEIIKKVSNAIKNAEKIDNQKENRRPNSLGTRVYRIVQDIIKLSS